MNKDNIITSEYRDFLMRKFCDDAEVYDQLKQFPEEICWTTQNENGLNDDCGFCDGGIIAMPFRMSAESFADNVERVGVLTICPRCGKRLTFVSEGKEYCGTCCSEIKRQHYRSSPESWANMCGREGVLASCQKCGRPLAFECWMMN